MTVSEAPEVGGRGEIVQTGSVEICEVSRCHYAAGGGGLTDGGNGFATTRGTATG